MGGKAILKGTDTVIFASPGIVDEEPLQWIFRPTHSKY
jgi:hypothetical protein